jgi:hypothetical protein
VIGIFAYLLSRNDSPQDAQAVLGVLPIPHSAFRNPHFN